MRQLEGRKCSFLLCLGMSTFICSLIYLRTRTPLDPKGLERTACGALSTQCSSFLPGMEEGVRYPHDCQIEDYVHNGSLRCSNLPKDLHFITSPLSLEEKRYPLAFILTVHHELELFVRLLRAIYMPQNVYCVHVDSKASPAYKAAVRRLVGCFPNAFLASRSETVTYAGFSRLQADINCMSDLVQSHVGWKKVVNLCGQDFPIMSNLELVRYLQSKEWRDRNMTPGIKQPPWVKHRTQLQYREIVGSHVAPKGPKLVKAPPPHNLEIYFGTAYYALTRAFVDFVLTSKTALDLLQWSKDTFSPDEHYWVTLNNIEEAPSNNIGGGWSGEVRAIKWSDQEEQHGGCKGRYVRDICVYGLEDLQWIISKNSMFANKFDSKTFPGALDCLEHWHRRKVLNQASVPIQPSWRLSMSSTNSSSSYFNANAAE